MKQASCQKFKGIDIRAGRVIMAETFPDAIKPAYN
jgi:hypothetical protein